VISLNKWFNKFLFSSFLLFILVLSLNPVLAAEPADMPFVIYETSNSQYLGSGIKYENIKKFTSDGWWNLNVIRVDLTDEYAEVKGLVGQNGISGRDTVSNMVTNSKAVAGVNGDFFNYTPIPYSLGTLVSEGKVVSSPRDKELALPTFFLDFNNNPDIGFFDKNMSITSLNSGKSVKVHEINKSTTYNLVIYLDSNWGPKSFGNEYRKNVNNADILEMVVVNDTVQDIRINREAVAIPKNGYIITAIGSSKDAVLNSFQIGDKVKFNINMTPNLDNIKFAIGGGSVILKDGQVTNTHINIAGKQPRTGIGISQDRKELIIATIDGKNTYIGVTQEMFGAILRDLGAYNAINLDGGGSTTMAIRKLDEDVAKVVNNPSEGTQRKVVNGVGVFSNAPKGELSYIEVYTDDSKMFVDTTRSFFIKGYDQYHNPVEVDNSKVEYTFTGVDGEISGNKFKAKSSGTAVVQAAYEGITSSIEVKVLGEVKSIIVPMDRFSLNVNSKKEIGTIYGLDKNGYRAKIYNEDIMWTVKGNVGYVEDGVFYSRENSGAGAITLKVGDVINNILISVGTGKGTAIEGFENINNFNSLVYPDYVVSSISLKEDAKEGKYSIGLKYDFTKGKDTRASYLAFIPNGKDGLALNGNPVKLSLWLKGDGNGAWLRGRIKDAKGTVHTVDFTKNINFTDWQKVEADIPASVVYPITLERIYVAETNSNKLYTGEILIDGLEAYYPPKYDESIAPAPTKFVDEKNVKGKKAEDGFTLLITKLPDGFSAPQENTLRNKANKYDVNLFIGQTTAEFNNSLKSEKIINIGKPYINHTHRNISVIDASSRLGGIRTTNPQQWTWLKNHLANTQNDHIMLFLNTPIFGSGGFKDQMEAEVLHNTLVETMERGKTVWVFYPGSSTEVQLRDGIRYIQIGTSMEFVINGSEITYQIN